MAKCLQPFSELNRLQVINHLPNATLNNRKLPWGCGCKTLFVLSH